MGWKMDREERPKISVCQYRKMVSIGCFDGFDCIRDFIDYAPEDEDKGISEARWFFEENGFGAPEIVRPSISKMKITYRR